MLCPLCHTPISPATGRTTPDFLAGGMRVTAYPWGVWYSRNLTPDPETGLGAGARRTSCARSGRGVTPDGRRLDPMAMPWPWFSRLTEDDARAVATYLRALPPVAEPRARGESTCRWPRRWVGSSSRSLGPGRRRVLGWQRRRRSRPAGRRAGAAVPARRGDGARLDSARTRGRRPAPRRPPPTRRPVVAPSPVAGRWRVPARGLGDAGRLAAPPVDESRAHDRWLFRGAPGLPADLDGAPVRWRSAASTWRRSRRAGSAIHRPRPSPGFPRAGRWPAGWRDAGGSTAAWCQPTSRRIPGTDPRCVRRRAPPGHARRCGTRRAAASLAGDAVGHQLPLVDRGPAGHARLPPGAAARAGRGTAPRSPHDRTIRLPTASTSGTPRAGIPDPSAGACRFPAIAVALSGLDR